jgi:hypothetical protein
MANELVVEERTTNDLMKLMFNELDMLLARKITPVRANAAARIGMAVVEAANLEVQHHKMKPARGNVVRPVTLVRREITQALLPAPKKSKR